MGVRFQVRAGDEFSEIIIHIKMMDDEASREHEAVGIAGVNLMKKAVSALNEEGPQRLLSRKDDPLVVLLRQNDNGAERAFTLINTQERHSREVVAEELLAAAGLAYLDDRLLLSEAQLGGGEKPVAARFTVAPLEVRVLRAALRPARQVPIGPCGGAARNPAHHPAWRPEARIVIEAVYPEINGGRHPAKAPPRRYRQSIHCR